MRFVTSIKIGTMMSEVSSEQPRSQLYIHAECCRRCCCYSVCCYTAVAAAAAVLLLPAAVRHRVPDCRLCCWFIGSDPSVFFLIQETFFVCTPWQYCRICGRDLATSSITTGLRGAQAGVIPPRQSPPCKYGYTYQAPGKVQNICVLAHTTVQVSLSSV